MSLFRKDTAKENASKLLFITTFLVYAVISMTKGGYAASIAPIISEGIFNKSSAGIVSASFYVFYGTAQLVGVKLVDNISPIKLVTVTLFGTLIATIGMAFSQSFWSMLFFWSFCGLIQFAIWPAIIRILSEHLLLSHRDKANVYISFAYCTGAFINYLIASVVLGITRWPVLFLVMAAIVLLCIVFWFFVLQKTKTQIAIIVEENKVHNAQFTKHDRALYEPSQQKLPKLLLSSGVLLLLIPAFIRTCLDAGLKSWVPTMMVENYHISTGFASTLTTVLMLINAAGVFITGWLYPRKIKSAVWAFALCFALALPFTLLLLFMGKISVVFVALLLTVITTLMYAGNQLIIVIVPSHFISHHKTGSIASILNAIASFGAVFSGVAFGFLAEHNGWLVTIASWSILALLAFVFCVAATPFWKSFTNHKPMIMHQQ